MEKSGLRRLIAAVVLIVVASLALVLGVLVPRVREAARRDTCRRQLRCIGLTCHMYADDSDNEFPSNWQQLYPCYFDHGRIVSCPSSPSTWQDFRAGTVTERSSSYVLVPGLRSDMPGIFILIYENPGNHGNGFHVVRGDASVEWWSAGREAEFRRFIELQAEALAKWRGSGKPPMGINDFVGPEFEALMMGRPFPPPPEKP